MKLGVWTVRPPFSCRKFGKRRTMPLCPISEQIIFNLIYMGNMPFGFPINHRLLEEKAYEMDHRDGFGL